MSEKKLDALLVSKAENIFYLSRFTGGSDARLFIDFKQQSILTDARYLAQVKQECPGWDLVEEKPPGMDQLLGFCRKVKRLGFEAHHITYQFYKTIEQSTDCELVSVENLVEALRAIKDEGELEKLRKTASIGDETFSRVLKYIQPGQSEINVANQISFLLRDMGCSKESFDTIVLAGEHASLPHGHPGKKSLLGGDMVTMDFGGFYHYYAGDMTRTVVVQYAAPRLREIYEVVLEAQQAALNKIKAGVSCRDVDSAVRKVFKKADLEQYFQHSTGHGLGLEVHEYPSLSQRSNTILSENMVVTVEPGIYIPGWGGIRIEDTVIVEAKACEILTRSDKGLLIV